MSAHRRKSSRNRPSAARNSAPPPPMRTPPPDLERRPSDRPPVLAQGSGIGADRRPAARTGEVQLATALRPSFHARAGNCQPRPDPARIRPTSATPGLMHFATRPIVGPRLFCEVEQNASFYVTTTANDPHNPPFLMNPTFRALLRFWWLVLAGLILGVHRRVPHPPGQDEQEVRRLGPDLRELALRSVPAHDRHDGHAAEPAAAHRPSRPRSTGQLAPTSVQIIPTPPTVISGAPDTETLVNAANLYPLLIESDAVAAVEPGTGRLQDRWPRASSRPRTPSASSRRRRCRSSR